MSSGQGILPPPSNNQAAKPGRVNHVFSSPHNFASGFTSNVTSNSDITAADRVGITGLNDTQWKALVSMLNERTSAPPSGKSFQAPWIIDIGATNHMTGTLDFLVDICEMSPMLIKLPDGRFTVSTKIGKAILGSSFSLNNVLFVDGLHCHLISVSQLTKETRCIFQITNRLCIIQDRITAMLIAAGKEQNGLYFFKEMNTQAAVQHVGSTSVDVWHCRLGLTHLLKF